MNDYYWKLFEKTGKIHDYLHYACASEADLKEGREEGRSLNGQGNGFRDGVVNVANRGVR